MIIPNGRKGLSFEVSLKLIEDSFGHVQLFKFKKVDFSQVENYLPIFFSLKLHLRVRESDNLLDIEIF